ncbi:hypothetical protein [Claveliimonas bilis]|uniref:Uncharacterized protein n=1 Tax=Claveliimonas bilis TaxID=3028070 RepID=A0ABM8I1X5_9FIRM|nr:hypothetical protein [Claveliimonas bilis]BDZ76946.1 hypothetical protein Lac1_11290 [Claveliimonas bilis]
MDIFNVIAGIASIIGLFFSIGIAIRTGSIKQQIEYSHTAEEFNINRDDILLNLLSSGKNAVRNEFSNAELLPEFQRDLIEYRKKYEPLFSEQELSQINEMIDLISSLNLDSSEQLARYRYLLNEITTKPNVRR